MVIQIFTLFICIFAFCYTTSAQKVSQYLNQVIKYEQEEGNPPRNMYISLDSDDLELQYIRGTRVMITGKVVLHMTSIFFLESLIKKGRYNLYLSPDGGSGLRLEDKVRRPIILRNETCREEIAYTIYIPETIKTVIFENTNTGEKKVIHVENRISRTLAERHHVREEAPPASAAPQVSVINNSAE